MTEENGTVHQGRGNIGELTVIAIYDVDNRLRSAVCVTPVVA
ncbi:MAG: hypothetical protein R3F37_17715 [Candidatus Competibacteraceae bacterium]